MCPTFRLWLYLFLSSFSVVVIVCFNLLDLKVNYHLYDYIAVPAILVASFALYKLLRSRNIKVIWAAVAALAIPAILIGYPEVTTRYDLYCAERNPKAFHYDASKKDSIIPCANESDDTVI